MSLARSADISSPSFENHAMLYHRNESNDQSAMSNQRFKYMMGSYFDPNYLLDPLSEELTNPAYQLMENSDSSLAVEDSFKFEYLEIQSPHSDDFSDDQLRLKLQELERELLEDNDADMFSPDAPLHDDSPKEDSSSSSDSNLSSISSCSKETPKDMLFNCAAAIAEGNTEEASTMINDLRQRVSIQGDPPQRVVAYMVEGLAARMVASGSFLYNALKCKEPPSSYRLAAMQILFEVCPCFKFGFMAANGVIMEAFKDERRVHIIDFDVNQGNQYITLIQTLASSGSRLPHIRLTGVDDPESVNRAVGGLKIVGQRLGELAGTLNVPFEFQAVASEASAVTPAMLGCQAREALIFNFAFQLHHMPDESVSTVNERDRLLRMVKSLKPKLVTIVEQDMNTNTAPFLLRFNEVYGYYGAVFESLDMTLPRESQDRMNVERHCLAREIINIVACEGVERIERYEVAGKWRARMMMAGFVGSPMSAAVNDAIWEANVRQYCGRYRVKEEMGGLHLGWEDKTLVVASAWR